MSILRSFSALNEAYDAYEAKDWQLFKEKYLEFLNGVKETTKEGGSTFLNALVADALNNKFIEGLPLPDELEKQLYPIGDHSEEIREIVECYIDVRASLTNELVSMRREIRCAYSG